MALSTREKPGELEIKTDEKSLAGILGGFYKPGRKNLITKQRGFKKGPYGTSNGKKGEFWAK